MSEYQITCCSTADMPAQYFEEKKIPFVCFNFLMDGVQYPDDLGKSMPFKEFYKKIADGAEPTTAQVNTQQYMELFEPILQKGLDILHLTLSSGFPEVLILPILQKCRWKKNIRAESSDY